MRVASRRLTKLKKRVTCCVSSSRRADFPRRVTNATERATCMAGLVMRRARGAKAVGKPLREAVLEWLERHLPSEPDVYVGGKGSHHMLRWHLIPRNKFIGLYFHKMIASDDTRALHDHPYLFNASWILRGAYTERGPNKLVWRKPGSWAFRWGASPHMLLLDIDPRKDYPLKPVWTLFLTGPRVREWGFLCPKGWRSWFEFHGVKPNTEYNDANSWRDKGCD